MVETFLARYPYWTTLVLLLLGLYGMLAKRNLMKKLIGMNIFQTAIILFFISISTKRGGTVPVILSTLGPSPERYVNPLPHVLMLTAIVVSVATTGVALALLLSIYRRYGSLDENTVLEKMR